MMRAAALSIFLMLALAEVGCAGKPRPVANTAGEPKTDSSPALKPKEGLTFRPQTAIDGSNTDPHFSGTDYKASDGETLEHQWYSFKQRETADKFFSDEVARARAVLEEATQDDGPNGSSKRRAVIESVTKDGRAWAAVVEQ